MQFGILGLPAPELDVNDWIDPDGKPSAPFRLEDHAGKVRVIYCFQAWCPSCHSAGFPALKEIMGQFADNGDVVFTAVQTVFEGFTSNGPERRREMQLDYGLALPIGQDETGPRPSVTTAYRTGGTPWFIVIDRQGKVIHNGYRLEPRKAKALIEDALAGALAPETQVAKLRHLPQDGRFEIHFPSGVRGITEYVREGAMLRILHTEISRSARGQGLGGWMMELVFEEMERLGLKAVPVCSYAAQYLSRYQRWNGLNVGRGGKE